MTDIQAAVGRIQLQRLPEIVKKRRELADRYNFLIEKIPEVVAPLEPEWARSTWQSYCIRLPASADQLKVMQSMLDDGIATRRGVMCSHREPAYQFGDWLPAGGSLAQSEYAQDHTIILPLYPQLTHEDQDKVVEALSKALA